MLAHEVRGIACDFCLGGSRFEYQPVHTHTLLRVFMVLLSSSGCIPAQSIKLYHIHFVGIYHALP
jgi:hypothetical protein